VIKEKDLKNKKIPKIFWTGIMLVSVVAGVTIKQLGDFRNNKLIFPTRTKVVEVIDGDTIRIKNGLSLRMIGIDAPNREDDYDKYLGAKRWLEKKIGGKEVNIEYDRHMDEKFGRLTGYVWLGCEAKEPKFLAWDYMKKNKSESMPELTTNPEGCKKGEMVNEEAIKTGMAKFEVYGGRGRLKYQGRLEIRSKNQELRSKN